MSSYTGNHLIDDRRYRHDCEENDPSIVYKGPGIREPRPNPASLDVDITGAGETGSVVGSFPRLVLWEGVENPCVQCSCPEQLSGLVVRSSSLD